MAKCEILSNLQIQRGFTPFFDFARHFNFVELARVPDIFIHDRFHSCVYYYLNKLTACTT